MKFQLSTLLLIIVIVAILLGWYVDRSRPAFIGRWHYPIANYKECGAILTIRTDGTFERHEWNGGFAATYSGQYRIDRTGRVIFRLISRSEVTPVGNEKKRSRTQTPVNAEIICRCAVDNSGFLLIDVLDRQSVQSTEDVGFFWGESFAPE